MLKFTESELKSLLNVLNMAVLDAEGIKSASQTGDNYNEGMYAGWLVYDLELAYGIMTKVKERSQGNA